LKTEDAPQKGPCGARAVAPLSWGYTEPRPVLAGLPTWLSGHHFEGISLLNGPSFLGRVSTAPHSIHGR